MQIVIDPEFSQLIPPLTEEEFAELEKSIKEEGCRDALVVWNDAYFANEEAGYSIADDPDPYVKDRFILIDGHNRYRICQKYGIEFQTVEEDLYDRDEVKAWIIKNQFGRRNLSTYDRSVLALKLKPLIAKKAKAQQTTHTEQGYQKSDKAVTTAKELATIAGVSHDTIHKVETIENKAPEQLKKQVRTGKKTINSAYNEIKQKEVKRPPTAAEYREQVQARHEELKDQKVVSVSDIVKDKQDVGFLSGEIKGDFLKAFKPINNLYVLLSSKELDTSLLVDVDRKSILANIDQTAMLLQQIKEIVEKG